MSEDKARAAFEAHASGSPGTTDWDELPENVKAAFRAAVETARTNDPKLVNTHASGTVGSMIASDPNVNPNVAPAARAPQAASPEAGAPAASLPPPPKDDGKKK